MRLPVSCALLALVAGCASKPDRPRTFAERKTHFEEHKQVLLTEFDLSDPQLDIDELYSPGVPRDGIASVDAPAREPARDAAFPEGDGRVVEVVIEGEAVAYPLSILGVHEIANDTVGDRPIAVTYCPLCDSVSVVDRRLPGGGSAAEFGVSGMLYRSNLTMYDRTTDSLWSQAGMTALTGPYSGESLEHLPWRVVSFDEFRRRHPEGEVMSRPEDGEEDYDDDAYASYFATDDLYMPVEHGDALPPKTLGVGLRAGDLVAFVTADFAAITPIHLSSSSGPVVVESGDAGMIVVDAPPDAQVIQTFYFAWSAFHPDTIVIE